MKQINCGSPLVLLVSFKRMLAEEENGAAARC